MTGLVSEVVVVEQAPSGACGAVALVDRDFRGSAAAGDRVDDGDLADQAKAGRVVDTIAARRGRGDRVCRGLQAMW